MANEDEVVDGPKIAAQILSRMAPESQARIRAHIAERYPEIVVAIDSKMTNFERLSDISDKAVQTLLNATATEDLALAVQAAQPELKDRLLKNVSRRRQQLVYEHLELLGTRPPQDIAAAQRRIMETLEDLRRQGTVLTEDKQDVWV